jgi:hypothetical protein
MVALRANQVGEILTGVEIDFVKKAAGGGRRA